MVLPGWPSILGRFASFLGPWATVWVAYVTRLHDWLSLLSRPPSPPRTQCEDAIPAITTDHQVTSFVVDHRVVRYPVLRDPPALFVTPALVIISAFHDPDDDDGISGDICDLYDISLSFSRPWPARSSPFYCCSRASARVCSYHSRAAGHGASFLLQLRAQGGAISLR